MTTPTPQAVIDYRAQWGVEQIAFARKWIRPGMDVLDCCCGPGSITVALAEWAYPGRVVGVDNDPLAVTQAQQAVNLSRRPGNVTLTEGDIGKCWEFGDASMDVVFFHVALCCLKEPRKALNEAFRVLKSGGLLIAREADRDGDLWFPEDEDWKKVFGYLNSTHPGDPFFGKKLKGLALDVGFKLLEISASYDFPAQEVLVGRLKSIPEEAKPSGIDLADSVKCVERTIQSSNWLYAQSRVEIACAKPTL
jgi:ubiquinone/menaquinone biosynthesis C-methylase UbiE